MLQHLADGRVDLMMGRGNMGPVYPWFGQDIRNGIPLAVRELRAAPPAVARGRRRLGGQVPDAADRASRRRRARSTACRRSSGTARSAARRSPSRPPTTATASSTTTSSGRRSHVRRMVDLYRRRFEHYGHGPADQAIVGLGGQVFMRDEQPGRDPRVPAVLRPRAGLRRRAVARGLHGPDAADRRQPAAGHRPDARLPRDRRRLPAPAVPRRPRRPAARRPSSSSWRSSGELVVPVLRREFASAAPGRRAGRRRSTRASRPRGAARAAAPSRRAAEAVPGMSGIARPRVARRRHGRPRPAVVDPAARRPAGRRRPSATSARPASSRAVEVIELREHAQDLANHLLTGFPSPDAPGRDRRGPRRRRADRGHPDLQRLVQRPVQAVLRRRRARRLRRQARR